MNKKILYTSALLLLLGSPLIQAQTVVEHEPGSSTLLAPFNLQEMLKQNPEHTCWQGPQKICYPKTLSVKIGNQWHAGESSSEWVELLDFAKWPGTTHGAKLYYSTGESDDPQIIFKWSDDKTSPDEFAASNSVLALNNVLWIQADGKMIINNSSNDLFTRTRLLELDQAGVLREIPQSLYKVMLKSWANTDFDLYDSPTGKTVIAKIKKGEPVTVLANSRRHRSEDDPYSWINDFLVINQLGVAGWIQDEGGGQCIWGFAGDTKKILDLCFNGD